MKTEKELAQGALDVQDACNLSGVVRSFQQATEALWEIARTQNKGTDWVNNHPVCRAYADKIALLTGNAGVERSQLWASLYSELQALGAK